MECRRCIPRRSHGLACQKIEHRERQKYLKLRSECCLPVRLIHLRNSSKLNRAPSHSRPPCRDSTSVVDYSCVPVAGCMYRTETTSTMLVREELREVERTLQLSNPTSHHRLVVLLLALQIQQCMSMGGNKTCCGCCGGNRNQYNAVSAS